MRRAVVGLVLLGGCVSHPVGPARTVGKYESKARTTVESALSEVATARMAAGAAAEGRAFEPYTSQVLSEAEESLGGLSGTFGSVQPPDDDTEELRTRVLDAIGQAEDDVTALRIASRRGDHPSPSSLDADIDALTSLSEELA